MYPLVVLLEATARATAIPLVFWLDLVQRSAPQTGIRATYRNVPNQEPLLDGRHRKRSGREIAGNDACRGSIGKSFATEFRLCRGLRWRSALSTAGAGLMFWLLSTCTLQFVLSRPCASCWFALLPSPCQGSTSAAAREKLRYCEVYLAIHSDEAGAWLCPAFANGGATGPSKYIDLQLYLNAAHGGSFSFSTQIDRQKVIKQKVLDPKAPVPEAAGMTLKETNVHVIFLQQELFLSNWWAPVAANKPYINIYSPINIP